MHRRTIAALVAALLVGLVPTAAQAAAPMKRERKTYLALYFKVKAKQGARAPGRQVLKLGVRVKHGVRPATAREVADSIRRLRVLLMPLLRAGPPHPAPAYVATARAGSFANCVKQRESGGNGQASNGSHWGYYQFDDATWSAATGLGGHASSYPESVQDQAFARWYPSHPSAWAQTAPGC